MVPSSDPALPELRVPDGTQRDQFDAMGTQIVVLASPELCAKPRVQRLFREWELTLSRFQADSELSYLNAHPGMPITVSPLLWKVLAAALTAARDTHGIFDPTLLHQLNHAGYDRTFGEIPSDRPLPPTPTKAGGGWRSIRVDPRTRTVTLPEGVALDFGGIAKGMAVDAALEELIAHGAPYAAIDAGGDLRVHGLPPDQCDWPIAVEIQRGYETIALFRGALATSSVARRHWQQGGRLRHHILDPRSGEPARSGIRSASVAAGRCVQADVAAKSALILGRTEGVAFLRHLGLAALVVLDGGELVRVGSWPAAERAA